MRTKLLTMRKAVFIFLVIICLALIIYLQQRYFFSAKKVVSKEELIDEFNRLRSVPYISYTKKSADQSKRGVVFYNKEKAFQGYNLCTLPRDYSGSVLLDMQGEAINYWQGLRHISILDDAKMIGSSNNSKIGKYDKDFNLIWEKNTVNHHEVMVTPEKNILFISYEWHVYNQRKIKFDIFIELSQNGKELSRWSTWENFKQIKSLHKDIFFDRRPNFLSKVKVFLSKDKDDFPNSYYHANAIQIFPDTPLGRKDKRFQKGNWLVCLRNVNLILILDGQTKNIVWSYGLDVLEGPHTPTVLTNGNVLIYDNGVKRRYSRVIEVNPVDKSIVWEYKAKPPGQFFSETRGSCQRLPNGNTLITESLKGRVFEVTKQGEIVWEWFNPELNHQGKRLLVYRMKRIPKKRIDKVLFMPYNNKK